MQAQVLYIDYGNTAEVEIGTMVNLSDELAKISPLAQKIKLIGVAPQLSNASSEAAKQVNVFTKGVAVIGGHENHL